MIELLTAMSILIILLMSMASISSYVGKSTLNNHQQNEAVFLHQEIYSTLRDPRACSNSFLGFKVNDYGGMVSLPSQIKRTDNSVAYQTTDTYSNGKLMIQEMRLGDFVADDSVTAPDSGKAYLHILIKKMGDTIGGQTLLRDIRLQVTRDSLTKDLINCVAIGGTKDIWLLNPDGSIFYNGGNVGIGQFAPSPMSLLHLKTTVPMAGPRLAGTSGYGIELDGPNVDVGIRSSADILPGAGPDIDFYRNRGGELAGGSAIAGDKLGSLRFFAWNGASYGAVDGAAKIEVDSAGAGPNIGANISFHTRENGVALAQERLTIQHDGKVGIGTATPTQELDVAGNINASGCVRAGASVLGGVCSSDERLKREIEPFELGLDALKGISPKYFKYNGLGEHPPSGKSEIGVIAQDIETSAPEIISSHMVRMNSNDKTATQIKQVNYSAFIYIVINAVKELYNLWANDSADLHAAISERDQKIKLLEEQNAKVISYLCQNDPTAGICRGK